MAAALVAVGNVGGGRGLVAAAILLPVGLGFAPATTLAGGGFLLAALAVAALDAVSADERRPSPAAYAVVLAVAAAVVLAPSALLARLADARAPLLVVVASITLLAVCALVAYARHSPEEGTP